LGYCDTCRFRSKYRAVFMLDAQFRLSGVRNQSRPQLSKSRHSQANNSHFATSSRRRDVLPKLDSVSQNLHISAQRKQPRRTAPLSRCAPLALVPLVSPNCAMSQEDKRWLPLRSR
jgi:hypothetical protein